MAKKMLIDASHEEETRVAIMTGNRLDEFDFESNTKRQLKGNIYLAKVVRIEPSLQAAFVEYGGNRHGFLPFSEIHPDYYRIPVEDREKLLEEQAAANKKRQGDDDAPPLDEDAEIEVPYEPEGDVDEEPHDALEIINFSPDNEVVIPTHVKETSIDVIKEEMEPFIPLHRRYKIQEVIKRRQIMLIQVNKEERGGKGAALTTYLSLAGRYGVLMPNSPNSGGISRKITNVGDRKRLRSLIEDIDLPESMSLIIRTAGMSRTKPEIKRDCDYLIRLWNDIRELTLKSEAPCLIYEEGNLIKRAIRDYYDKDIDEVLVEGEAGFEEAKKFMKQLMPSHVKRVKEYKSQGPSLFQRNGIEDQLSSIHTPTVRLKSGGYIVFGTTEALVAIDVNSGKATKERHIDDTALNTNLEAADEIAYQLRLRDLAGLVVIDFIDMEDPKHIEAVERRLRDAMRNDRARVQIGRISMFGLLELSRQRLRPNIIEATSIQCRHCQGTGMMRSDSSVALQVLRAVEEEASGQRCESLVVYMPVEVSLYLLNEKPGAVEEIESKWGVSITIKYDSQLVSPEFRIEKDGAKRGGQRREQTKGRRDRQEVNETRDRDPRRSRRVPNKQKPQDKSQPIVEAGDASEEPQDAPQSGESKPKDEKRGRRRGGRRRSPRRRQGQERSATSGNAEVKDEKAPAEDPQDKKYSKENARQTKQNEGTTSPKEVDVKELPVAEKPIPPAANVEEEPKKKVAKKSWIKKLLD